MKHEQLSSREQREELKRKRRTRLIGTAAIAVICPATGLASAVLTSNIIHAVKGQNTPALPEYVSPTRLLPTVKPPPGKGGYRFLTTQENHKPVTWDPCRPIRYVYNPSGEVKGGKKMVNKAINRIEKATGLDFVDMGTTSEPAVYDRPVMDKARYGDSWSPVLIAWADPSKVPFISGYAGLGGPDSITYENTTKHVSGMVILNGPHLKEVETWPQGKKTIENVVTHELGHLVGLDHVDDSSSLMFRRPTSQHLTNGDLRGLARVGMGACLPALP